MAMAHCLTSLEVENAWPLEPWAPEAAEPRSRSAFRSLLSDIMGRGICILRLGKGKQLKVEGIQKDEEARKVEGKRAYLNLAVEMGTCYCKRAHAHIIGGTKERRRRTNVPMLGQQFVSRYMMYPSI